MNLRSIYGEFKVNKLNIVADVINGSPLGHLAVYVTGWKNGYARPQ